ncbi:MAG: hypothetical protein LBR23_09350 [Spirochaetaceae bacterium]|jgi:hypothetical protein|nr:hypothetical protein [Spirochaetaceae bacterium]
MDDLLAEVVKIRELLEKLAAGSAKKPAPLLRRGWVIVLEVAAFLSALVSIIIYVIDYLMRYL